MRVLKRLLFLLLCTVPAATPATAGLRAGAVEVGVFSGSYFLDEDDTGAETTSAVNGFRIGFMFTREHEIEFVADGVDVKLAGSDIEEIYSVNLRYLYNWAVGNRSAAAPYIGAGLGSVDDEVFDTPFGDVSDDDTQFSVFGGLRVFATRSFALRGEMAVKTFSTFDIDQSVVEITAGLTWELGGRRGAGPY
jgi:hypothetical protein